MKKLNLLIATISSLILFACAPVLDRELMKEGDRNPPLNAMRANPEPFKGKLFILGGPIVDNRFVPSGSQIEVFDLPVDCLGYIKETGSSQGRFLAIYPKERGLLDPVIYRKGKEVTLAGTFLESKQSKIDDMEYVYPVFQIDQIYLWEEQPDYNYNLYPYPYGYYTNPYWYHPYWGPWPPPTGW